jgi:L-asparaginase
MVDETSILIIYTGGTIGMIVDETSGSLVPFNFDLIYEQIPVLKKFHFRLGFHCFDPILDSSNMNPSSWIELASIIEINYEEYDGFVVLHGSDTMAFSASALSFLLENLNKPVIFTGSQLPMGVLRTDGRENFITAIEIAAAKENNTPVVPEVCVYFENRLMRGNRTVKYNAENFNAFISGNYPLLAEVGVFIKYNENAIQKPNFKKLKVHQKMDTQVGILKLFPGISKQFVESVLSVPGLKGLVLETFGTGNAPNEKWFLDLLKKAVDSGLLIINITQCLSGRVIQGKYETSKGLKEIGIISGHDMTTEATLVKMMYLFGEEHGHDAVKELMQLSLRGEVSLEKQQ